MRNPDLKDVTLLSVTSVKLPETIKALNISQAGINFGKVLLLTSENEPSTPTMEVVHIPKLDSIEKYSEFMIKDLNRYIKTPYVLIVQADGFVLNPAAWSNKFYKYDYIGAPWAAQFAIDGHKVMKPSPGGNGGFCLRSKKCLEACERLATEGRFKRYDPEDIAICLDMKEAMKEQGINIAPVEVGERFSLDNWYNGTCKWNGQFGFHSFKSTDISRWTKANPEWGIRNERIAPRPVLDPRKKDFWSQMTQPNQLRQKFSDWRG
ncbi:MAG TPA: DUF5672 family protein [Verrucomicrobiae bacterium]|nr:DUF5672 family protein [Verrucomicrobiae bacterium]